MKYKFSVSTCYVGSEVDEIIDIPDKELQGKTEAEIEEYIDKEYFMPWLWEKIDAYFAKEG